MGLEPYYNSDIGATLTYTFGATTPTPSFSLDPSDVGVYYNTRPATYQAIISLIDRRFDHTDFPYLFMVQSTAKCLIRKRVLNPVIADIHAVQDTISGGNGFFANWSGLNIDRIQNYVYGTYLRKEPALVWATITNRVGCKISGTDGNYLFTEESQNDHGWCLAAGTVIPIVVNSLQDSVITVANCDEAGTATSGVFTYTNVSSMKPVLSSTQFSFDCISGTLYGGPPSP